MCMCCNAACDYCVSFLKFTRLINVDGKHFIRRFFNFLRFQINLPE